jgi:CRISPR system Cascade subunit CasC
VQLEIHVLQSFPPANLNRDENGMPKSTVFGGRPRARISSQCQKRATRLFYTQYAELDSNVFAKRSKDWQSEISKLLEQDGVEKSQADLVAACTISVFTEKKEFKGKSKKKDDKKKNVAIEEKAENGKSDTGLFLGNVEIKGILNFLKTNWQQVEADILANEPTLSKQIVDGIKATVESKAKPGDVALFGRMMANLPSGKVDAAVQVAQAISVHTLQQEFDFFTAVDELAKPDSTGADHLGEMGFNGSTYYRLAILDTNQLIKNLTEEESAKTIASAFTDAFIQSTPSGHQNQCAHHTRPACVMIVVRSGQPMSLVDAFEKSVAPTYNRSLLQKAVEQLEEHWGDMVKMYGEKSVSYKGILLQENLAGQLGCLENSRVASLDELISTAITKAFPGV